MPKVLIVEDDLMIADMVEEILVKNGYDVCGIARTVAEAVGLGVHHKPDLALIDMRLADGGLGTDVAKQLAPLGRLGVLYASGNDAEVILTASEGDAYIVKPYSYADLLRALELVAEIVATSKASPPFPRTFHVLKRAASPPAMPPHG